MIITSRFLQVTKGASIQLYPVYFSIDTDAPVDCIVDVDIFRDPDLIENLSGTSSNDVLFVSREQLEATAGRRKSERKVTENTKYPCMCAHKRTRGSVLT